MLCIHSAVLGTVIFFCIPLCKYMYMYTVSSHFGIVFSVRVTLVSMMVPGL